MADDRLDYRVRLGLPKGHMQQEVFTLLADAGVPVHIGSREYRPRLALPGFDVKMMRSQNVVEMLHIGSRDVGFAGPDWVAELGADSLVEILDTGFDPVRIVAAAPIDILVDGRLPDRPLVIASEYENLTRRWADARGLDATVLRSYGATEAFPPEDADCIVDNTATGATLRSNRLEIIDELMTSSTRLYANARALDDPARREAIDGFVLLLRSVLEARRRIMLEFNITAERLDEVVAFLPCMKEPTISPLYHKDGFAVKAAVPRVDLPALIPRIKAHGGSDLVVTAPDQLVY